jgi:hypothetical protein
MSSMVAQTRGVCGRLDSLSFFVCGRGGRGGGAIGVIGADATCEVSRVAGAFRVLFGRVGIRNFNDGFGYV